MDNQMDKTMDNETEATIGFRACREFLDVQVLGSR